MGRGGIFDFVDLDIAVVFVILAIWAVFAQIIIIL